eukprot:Platyproteum_vivax@DN6433_c0_g1_i3.p2
MASISSRKYYNGFCFPWRNIKHEWVVYIAPKFYDISMRDKRPFGRKVIELNGDVQYDEVASRNGFTHSWVTDHVKIVVFWSSNLNDFTISLNGVPYEKCRIVLESIVPAAVKKTCSTKQPLQVENRGYQYQCVEGDAWLRQLPTDLKELKESNLQGV